MAGHPPQGTHPNGLETACLVCLDPGQMGHDLGCNTARAKHRFCMDCPTLLNCCPLFTRPNTLRADFAPVDPSMTAFTELAARFVHEAAETLRQGAYDGHDDADVYRLQPLWCNREAGTGTPPPNRPRGDTPPPNRGIAGPKQLEGFGG